MPALVLELVEGDTLDDRVRRGPLPLPEALAVAQQIADALKQLGSGIGLAEFSAYVGEVERTAKIVRNAQVFEAAQ